MFSHEVDMFACVEVRNLGKQTIQNKRAMRGNSSARTQNTHRIRIKGEYMLVVVVIVVVVKV